jgi:hypothetical protein
VSEMVSPSALDQADLHRLNTEGDKGKAIRGKHMYCPLVPPTDVTQLPDWHIYDGDNLPLRDRTQDRETADFYMTDLNMSKSQRDRIAQASGIKSRSCFWDLPSILWPWSFPIDNMHLFFLNIASYMRGHWQGNFFPWERSSGAKKTKFKQSTEDYNVPPSIWTEIDKEIPEMIFPTAFGDRIRGVAEFRKANKWKSWTRVLSTILLKERLPEPYYTEWVKFIEAITLATDYYSISANDVGTIR